MLLHKTCHNLLTSHTQQVLTSFITPVPSGKNTSPKQLGSGCAFIDYNNDGWQDILLVNGKDWEGEPTQKRQTMALYRNNRDSTFTDATESAGLAVPLYGMGVSVADYDNDGDSDIYISTLETDRLFQNRGDSTFVDVTEVAGIHNPGFRYQLRMVRLQ